MPQCAEKEFDEVFISHRPILQSKLVQIVGNSAIAEELTQESYLRVRQAISQGSDIQHLKGFLFQTGRNLALDHLRHKKRQSLMLVTSDGDDEVSIDDVPSRAPAPEQVVADQRAVQSLVQVLEGMTERQRKVFVLNRVHGWSHARIAAHIGTSESTVQKEVKLVMSICIAQLR